MIVFTEKNLRIMEFNKISRHRINKEKIISLLCTKNEHMKKEI